MNWKLIFNPFSKFSEIQLLVFGILITLLGSFIGSYFGMAYDGVFDVHQSEITFLQSIKENFINIFLVFLLLSALGKIINKRTRFIDILNTVLVARLPIYIVGLISANPLLESAGKEIMKNVQNPEKIHFAPTDLVILLVFTCLSLLLLVYAIVLLVNGFKTATNVKKWQHFVWFGVALILAEIISKILINYV